MKLQLALDDISLVDALVLAEKVRDYVDILKLAPRLSSKKGCAPFANFGVIFRKKDPGRYQDYGCRRV